MSKYAGDDHYIDPVSGVLKNRLGIVDEALLEQIEAEYAALRSYDLSQNPLHAPWSITSLQTIHQRLFGDVYEWAGEFRTVDISKGSTRFANWKHIENSLERLFAELNREHALKGLDALQFSQRAAYYMGEINAIHPFREGNGRTQREFLSQLAYQNGGSIAWHRLERDIILNATILSFQGRIEPLTQLIQENLIFQASFEH